MPISPEIPRHVRFFNAMGDEPRENGEAWLRDDGTLDVTGIAVSISRTGRSRNAGSEWFMTYYASWSNGYVYSKAAED